MQRISLERGTTAHLDAGLGFIQGSIVDKVATRSVVK
jgi:hypothetical protein